jgi:hypothetical protein
MKLADNQTTIYRLSKLPLVDLAKYSENNYNEVAHHSDSDHDLPRHLLAVLSSSPAYFSPRILPLEDDTLHGKVYYDFLPTSDNSVTLYVCSTVNNASASQTAQFQIWNITGHGADDKQQADGAWTKVAQWDAPFLEPFIATTHAGAVYFITLSGDVYQFNREKASLVKIWNNAEGPALSCVTDLDSDHTSIYGRDYMFEIPNTANPAIFNGGVMAILDALSKQVDQTNTK